jgi:type I restriction enzyme S subunit
MIHLIPENSKINVKTKIATFLSSIDEKIEKCQGQIKKMENWKKGLLQQMFV